MDQNKTVSRMDQKKQCPIPSSQSSNQASSENRSICHINSLWRLGLRGMTKLARLFLPKLGALCQKKGRWTKGRTLDTNPYSFSRSFYGRYTQLGPAHHNNDIVHWKDNGLIPTFSGQQIVLIKMRRVNWPERGVVTRFPLSCSAISRVVEGVEGKTSGLKKYNEDIQELDSGRGMLA